MNQVFERYCWAPILDLCMRDRDVMQHRTTIIPRARGRVLEIGAGSGLNFEFYDAGQVTKLWALEPSEALLAKARRRAASSSVEVDVVVGSAEDLPFPDEPIARWQRRFNPLWQRFSGGCNMDRPIASLIEHAGFRINELDTAYLSGAKLLAFNYWGEASPA